MGLEAAPGPILALLSGVSLVGLGAVVARLRPRTLASIAFSLFAVLWGLQIVAANVYDLSTEAASGEPWLFLLVLLLLPLPLPLLAFALLVGRPDPQPRRATLALGLGAVPAVLFVLLYLANPAIFVRGVIVVDGPDLVTLPGPLYFATTFTMSILVFVAAAAVTAWRLRRAADRIARDQLALVTAALLAYVSYRAADGVYFGLMGFPPLSPAPALSVSAMVLSTTLALVLTLALGAWALARRDLPWRELLVACAVAPLAVGLLEWFVLERAGVPVLLTIGLWRLVMVALFAYALARYRLFDLELRLAAAAPVASYVVVALVALAVLWAVLADEFSGAPWLGVTASAGVAAVCAPALRAGRRVASRAAPHVSEPAYLHRRKLDVYRVALEEARVDGLTEGDEAAFLGDLRTRLGISEEEHGVLVLVLEGHRRHADPSTSRALAKFRIERELGRGTFGRAALARDLTLDRPVVLKQPLAPWVLEGEGRSLFLREAQLLARINHPNVVQVHEVVADVDPPMIVLEYVEGGTLEDLLREKKRLPAPRVARLGRDVLRGLSAVHDAGIVHRDMKPANILLTADGRAKVTDFGIAHPPPSFGRAATLATAGAQPGSLAYMSPEQARGDAVTAASDLYSVGVLLFEAVAGRFYLDLAAFPESKVRQLIETQRPRSLGTDVPAPLAAAIRRALAKDARDRFASAGEMAQALEHGVRGH